MGWGFQSNRILKVQKALIIITLSNNVSSTETLSTNFKILKLQGMYWNWPPRGALILRTITITVVRGGPGARRFPEVNMATF